jgi:YNFM family putative membrane transporter
MSEHLRNPALRASCGIGFCILFAFIGTFTYVNFVLPVVAGDDGHRLGPFRLPAIHCHDPSRGERGGAIWHKSNNLGRARRCRNWIASMLFSRLAEVLAGMVLVDAGTFFAQAAVTGFLGRAAKENHGVASGVYLACYFCGGLIGSVVLG